MIFLLIWLVLLSIFLGIPGFYYLYLRCVISKPWNLKINPHYLPHVTILVPAYNEEKTIRLKLQNLTKLKYPAEKLQIIIVNDGSTDNTLEEISNFQKDSSLDFTVINLNSHHGKIKALNHALRYAKGEIVIVSDADSFLPSDILYKTMPFFADPSIGAIISRQALLEPNASWVSETEKAYFDIVYGIVKLGESKLHSTIVFHGSFAAYRRSLLDQFNLETDDVGTALDIVQKGGRAIIVPDAVSFNLEFTTWRDKFNTKIRRATHNVKTWAKCLHLLFKGKLLLPKRIAIPEIFLYLFNPLVLLALCIMTILILISNPFLSLYILPLFIPILTIKRTRTIFIEIIQNNFFLLFAIINLLLRKEIIRWETAQGPRAIVKKELLREKHLI